MPDAQHTDIPGPGNNSRTWLSLAAVTAVILLWWYNPLAGSSSNETIDFNTDVRPILNENCLACHGGVRQSGGFSLLFASEALETNESGRPAFYPGHPDTSEMIRRVRHVDPEERMPLDRAPLQEEEIEILEKWIAQGAPWGKHWAYTAPEVIDPPYPRNQSWARNGIDQFILTRLEAEGLKPSPEADCSTLIRRASLDLIGLPPDFAEIEAYCSDQSPEAFRRAIDQMLASPHFGERWASMWMDLARYADTKGYEKDAPRTIWKFRDWVIDAFNEDMPFDQFTIEQLAGDLLPNPTDDQLIATAFHRNTMNNDEGGTDDEEFRIASVIDRVNTTWEVWMGTTMACVQCHSHPYDPFRQEEYYKFMAYFNNTADRDIPDESPTLATFSDEQAIELERHLIEIAKLEGQKVPDLPVLSDKKNRILYPGGQLSADQNDGFEGLDIVGTRTGSTQHNAYIAFDAVDLERVDELSVQYSSGGTGGYIDVRLGSPSGPSIGRAWLEPTEGWSDYRIVRFPIALQSGTKKVYFRFTNPGNTSLFNIGWFHFHTSVASLARADRLALLEHRSAAEAIEPEAATPILRELEGDARRTTHVFNRGNWLDPTEEVAPDVPPIMHDWPAGEPRNRLGVARWIASPENPLTSRVIVNRFWAELFGTGIVATLEDFGSQGASPSHPELLDWLATRFTNEHQWKVKSLLKEIVMSATYRQRSAVTEDVLLKDPDNLLLARGPRVRLSAEQMRDQALAVSGLLSDALHGPSVMPPQPEGIWRSPYSNLKWETSEGSDRYRRGLYTFWRRTAPYPSMVTFDSPSREFCVSRRIVTNTPLQALVTLNDPVYVEAAQALAKQMIATDEVLENRIRAGYRQAMLREPSAAELDVLRGLYKEAYFDYESRTTLITDGDGVGAASKSLEHEAMTVVANAILNLDEFITKG